MSDSVPTLAPRGDRPPRVNPQLLRDWARAAADGLIAARAEINELNVFPIPDSDTGSNMAFTMTAAADAAESADPEADAATVTRVMADAAVASARGNSGIILSQVLVGVADAAAIAHTERDYSFSRLFAGGLRLASLAAVRAVSEPREGTVLTVLRQAAEAAHDNTSASPADLARAAAEAAADALEHTPEQLAELAYAGVVDAGGRGMLVLLDSMVLVLTGVANRRRNYRGLLNEGNLPAQRADEACDGSSDMDFEVMYLLDGTADELIGRLRDYLAEIGDAVVIVGDSSESGERFSVHVHTNEPGKAVEAGAVCGAISDVRISCFALDALRLADPEEPLPRHKRGVVVIAKGSGAQELFAEAGAAVVAADDGLSVDEVADAIRATDAAHVVVMANGELASQELVAVAAQARSTHRSVVFIPTLSMVQCLSALAVHDPGEEADVDAYAMAEAAAGTRWGSVRRVSERVMTLAGTSEPGDMLGYIGSDALVIGHDPLAATTALLDLMLATGGELITVLAGSLLTDSPEVLDGLADHVRRVYPGIELTVYPCGQDDSVLQVGVE
ncbi:DAK2 domain-containing protein [Gordonia crocea]|uniref:Putative phosphatase/kinase n=1 Tax=Gordonia crocea TaxID=589162 RepID=A0A7I9UZX1_9ACTN|nr:DAK2 domain-containing protein [Gordonia crocea]GED98419.1 putative phosphatase/kinase [Gordonia crocea]